MKFFQIALKEDQVNFLKARWDLKTDGEIQRKLQRIAEDLINKQFTSSVDSYWKRIISVPHEKIERGETIEARVDDIVHTAILEPGKSINIQYTNKQNPSSVDKKFKEELNGRNNTIHLFRANKGND